MELAYKIIKEDKDHTLVQLIGPMEASDFSLSALPLRVKTDATLDLSQVGFLNSHLLVDWSQFVKEFSLNRKIIIKNCPSEVMYFFCLCPELLDNCHVENFTCNYYCDDCGSEFSVSTIIPESVEEVAKMETIECQSCGAEAESEMPLESFHILLNR